jgi:DNA-binding transcriptional regulator PaaX
MMGSMTYVESYVHAWLRGMRSDNLRRTTIWILWFLSERADPDGGNVWAGIEWLSNQLGLSPRTIRYALQEGRERGWLLLTQRGRRGKGVSIYSLRFPHWWKF